MFIKVGNRIINTDQVKFIRLWKDGEIYLYLNDDGAESSQNEMQFKGDEAAALSEYLTAYMVNEDVMNWHADRVEVKRRRDALNAGLCPDCGEKLGVTDEDNGQCNKCGFSKWD